MWGWLAACAGDDPVRPPVDGPTADSHDTGTTSTAGWAAPPRWVPNTDGALLLGWVDAELPGPGALTVVVDDGEGERRFVSEASTAHHLLITGLRPGTTHTLEVRADGVPTHPLTVVTDPVPADLPLPSVTVVDRDRLEPGVTFLVMADWMVMFDVDGVPVWLRRAISEDIHEVALTPRGTLLLQADRTGIVELSLTGAVLRSWRAARKTDEPAAAVPVDVLALHHDVVELPNGNLLGLSIERRTVDEYPTSEERLRPLAPADVVGDVIVEFAPDGSLVHEWSLLDRLSPQRIGYDSVEGDFWHGYFGGDEVRDWSHANSVWYDAARDEVVVSLRHQDAVVALAHATGDVAWIVAPDDWWPAPLADRLLRPATPDLLVPFHQHAAQIGPDGHLLLFDNGNRRASALFPPLPPGEVWTRGAELVLDHAAGTWSLAWEGGPVPPRFSGSMGDVDPLPRTGNRLVTFGNVKEPTLPGVGVYEMTGGAGSEVLWALEFPQGDGLGTFRAERFTDLVPGR